MILCPSDNYVNSRITASNWAHLSARGRTGVGNKGVSYIVGYDAQETQPQMILSGDRNITNNATDGTAISSDPSAFQRNGIYAKLGTNHSTTATLPGAGFTKDTHNSAGNLCLADGSVQQTTTAKLRQQLRESGDWNNAVGIGD